MEAVHVGIGRTELVNLTHEIAHDQGVQRRALWDPWLWEDTNKFYRVDTDDRDQARVRQSLGLRYAFFRVIDNARGAEEFRAFIGDTFLRFAAGQLSRALSSSERLAAFEDFLLTPEERLCSDIVSQEQRYAVDSVQPSYWRLLVERPLEALQTRVAQAIAWNRRANCLFVLSTALVTRLKRLREAVFRTVESPGQFVTASRHVTRGPNTSWMTPLFIHGGALACA
jgi:hypothetical protein